MNSNYYLNLLNKKIKELKKVLDELDSSDYSPDYKKYLISGYIIMLDSILEIGIGDLHSPYFDELTSLIYYTRQKAVHYGYFNGLHNIEDTASKIIELNDENYQKEQEYYSNLFNHDDINHFDNIVIKNSPNIELDTYFYKFKSKDKNQMICIPLKRIFKLTQKSKEKIDEYVIDTNNPVALYTFNNGEQTFKEIYSDEIKEFFKNNYTVTNEDYSEHIITMQAIIDSFINDPINSIQIMEYASDGQFCRNTIEVIKEYITENVLYKPYIHSNYLIKDKYSLSKMPKTDFSKLNAKIHKCNISNFINYKDVFFIEMTKKRFKFYSDILDDPFYEDDYKSEVLSTVLIQLFETGPKHFSSKFISSSPEFKKCYNNLQRYRQVFSHYVLSSKEYKDNLESFKNEFLGFLHCIDQIDLTDVNTTMKEEYATFNLIERDKSDFFNYKHEQFLRVSNDNYIGKKIHYSSHNSKSKSLIAIIPGGTNSANIMYYKKDANDCLTPKYYIDEKSGKKCYINALNKPIKGVKEAKIDFSLAQLFTAYYKLRKLKNKSDIVICFPACEENNDYQHYDDLETVILRFFNQGYLPIELLQKTKLDYSKLNKGIITIVDENNNLVASIINRQKCPFEINCKKDDKRFFSRIDDIKHDFSKRRHTK